MKNISCLAFAGIILVICSVLTPAQKLDAQQIIANHLNSIAPAERRQQLNTLFAAGLGTFEARTPVVRGGGRAVVVSDRNNLYFLMGFNSPDYPFEKIGMFGDKVALPFTTGGKRSLLGTFLAEHSRVLSESLFGGSMSLRWIDHLGKKAKMRSAGTKKINGKQAYVLDVHIGTGSDEFRVQTFFDAVTFHHVRSEYRREITLGQIKFGQQNQLTNATLDLIEEFSDHKALDGITLPYTYKVTFKSNSNSEVYESSWGIRVANYYYNQKLAPDFFTFDIKN